MEAGSDGETPVRNNSSNNNNNNGSNNKSLGNSSEGLAKPKRQMKTPYQLETLEKVYAVETYPSEATRAELSEKLGLSDRQLQMWFCHRRLKDKKEVPAKKPRKGIALPPPGSPEDELRVGHEPDYGSGSGSGSGSSPFMESRKLGPGSSNSRGAMVDEGPIGRRYYESPQTIMELRAIACVEAQLGEPLREDGPILGMEFDPLPPGAFGAPIEQQKRLGHPFESKLFERHDARSSKTAARALQEYQFLQDQPNLRSDSYGQGAQSHHHDSPLDGPRARASSIGLANEPQSKVHGAHVHVSRVRVLSQQEKAGHISSSAHGSDGIPAEMEPFVNNRIHASPSTRPTSGPEDPYVLSNGQNLNSDHDLRIDRKRKSDEARIAREAEAQENRIRRELEKLDNQRRKNEERIKKEMERHERERRKEEEKLLREKQREEERSQREQKREIERREKFLQREILKAEKRRQKEELRREKEAVRRKIAIEKATARRIAKESMDLIEDEQLELMELAAASKGIASIIQLDHDTLQNLEFFRDSLCMFPPQSVQLKRPFAIQPWSDSEENVGNLLMVWRFLITFTDILGLWPFTLDEFVQSFHDYDSRLLGEIHVTLLKSIIKDIEDVARTPTGVGANQYCSANPEGGHPQIVEGAYEWGFDIRNWQRHLNPLTWPEIFRQLALSAGFGPQLKRTAQWTYLCDNNEGKACEDVISTLRSGSAAESAFAMMREKGLLLPRRSRHRLTPGTVKFAAFHVLSLEGSKGLTVLELADKIQKSGLRDLTTSKTPEASISVALTRDAKLFERIAPSTYCVRAAYRKDPADAEAILAAARKKIRIFENGFLGGEDAEDVERDEDSECDVEEDPEVDDLATPSTTAKNIDDHNKVKTCSRSGNGDICNTITVKVDSEFNKDFSSLSSSSIKNASSPKDTEQHIAGEDVRADNMGLQNAEIDESKQGESWVQGLAEGDYSHLSVEERLNALVALIGVANEGNSIRAVLEDRLEAANALKKQMWAEAQVDKSRSKEESLIRIDYPSVMGSKAETVLSNSILEGSQSPLLMVDNRTKEASSNIAEDQKPSQTALIQLQNSSNERTLVAQDALAGQDIVSNQQHGCTSKRSRSQLKSYIAHRAEEMYVYRSLPLGQDRRRNRYWQFAASASRNDPCSGRIFVELHDGNWRLIDNEQAFEALLSSLDTRGVRESHLCIMLQKIETAFKENIRRNLLPASTVTSSGAIMKSEALDLDSSPDCPAAADSPSSAICTFNPDTLQTSSSFNVELGRNESEKKSAMKRYQDFQRWIWSECYNSLPLYARKFGKKRCMQLLVTCELCLDSYLLEDSHCLPCHQTFSTGNNKFKLSEHETQCEKRRKLDPKDSDMMDSSSPLGIRLLKSLLAFMEATVHQRWSGEKFRMMPPEGADDSSNSMEAGESDDNAQAAEYEQGNWEGGYDGASSAWDGDLMEGSEGDDDDAGDNDDASGDDNGIEDVGDEDLEDDVETSEGSDGMANKMGNDSGESEDSEDYSD
ncbi:homeobox-DDT domain protein RLT1 [Carica papaya]|uniref:homeobox-DDT domain protein RLT1 n=1 Tax=Carica papaya TaxID=3649 RepID=UPI000B8C8019|nr:homeobox-DDT domain protein RLT1 [Carica papaya]